ncbi:Hypothetical_protein [Hexamita inflata]|uniref:Hypothetical_protein n=1 Tax=Hexamita inflata TaxID=28002 RepID=A0AA86RN62_9EUKA|nr:Hypothetical protein HINF_LOCUS64268 [Hexamita inflata]
MNPLAVDKHDPANQKIIGLLSQLEDCHNMIDQDKLLSQALNHQIEQLNLELKLKQSEIDDLVQKQNQINEKILSNASKEEHKELLIKVNEIEEKKEELQKQVQKQIVQLTEATKQIETKNKELDTVKAEQKAEVEKIQQQHAEEKKALEAQLEQIQIQHSQTENKSTELIAGNQKAVEYTKSLENKIVDTQNENIEVKANLQQVQIENKAVYEQNKNLQECIDQLISKNQQQQAELEEQAAKFTQQVTAVEDELKTTRTQLKLVQAMGRKYDSSQQQQQEIIQQQKASIAKFEDELQSAKKLNQEQQQQLQNLEHTEQELAAFKVKNLELTECVDSLTQKTDKLQQKLSNNTTELKLAELQTLYKNQYKELSATKIDLERVTQEKASLVIQTKANHRLRSDRVLAISIVIFDQVNDQKTINNLQF